MSIVKRHLAEQEQRMVGIKVICIEGALVLDTATDDVYFSADEEAYKNTYSPCLKLGRRAQSRAHRNRYLMLQNPFLRTRDPH